MKKTTTTDKGKLIVGAMTRRSPSVREFFLHGQEKKRRASAPRKRRGEKGKSVPINLM